MNIGIIGQGFVGTAIYEGLRNFYHIETYDIVESKSSTTLEKLVISADIIFQCLPTPMKKTGECDLSIVENSLENIDLLSHKLERNPIVVVKSTVPPGACERLNKMYEKIDIVFSPEFLTEVSELTLYDSRIGKTHLMVPGPDGDFGFGGHCFPKDLAAMIYVAKNLGVEPSMLESTREKNNKVRKNRDWERMPGRAISKETK